MGLKGFGATTGGSVDDGSVMAPGLNTPTTLAPAAVSGMVAPTAALLADDPAAACCWGPVDAGTAAGLGPRGSVPALPGLGPAGTAAEETAAEGDGNPTPLAVLAPEWTSAR